MNKALLSVLLLSTIFVGCPRQRLGPEPPASAVESLRRGLDELEANRYKAAIEAFTFTIFNYPGSNQAADAQYWLAETYFRKRDYNQAQTEFDFYLKNFPNAQYREAAMFRLAEACFRSAPAATRDQSRTIKAGNILREFMEDYPESQFAASAESLAAAIEQRLAARELSAARLYFRAGEYRSALVYYDYLETGHPKMKWDARDRLQYGIALAAAGDTVRAQAVLRPLADGDCEEQYRRSARRQLELLSR